MKKIFLLLLFITGCSSTPPKADWGWKDVYPQVWKADSLRQAEKSLDNYSITLDADGMTVECRGDICDTTYTEVQRGPNP